MSITRTAKGTNTSKSSGTTLTLASVAMTTGDLLVVSLAYDDQTLSSVTWGSETLTLGTAVLGAGVRTRLAWKTISSGGTQTITATWASALTAKALTATSYHSSISGATAQDDSNATNTGTGTSATTAALSPAIRGGTDSILIGVMGTEGPSGDTAGTWNTPNTAGQRAGTTGNPAASNVTVNEGYQLAPTAASTPSLSQTGHTSRDWGAALRAFYWASVVSGSVTADAVLKKTTSGTWTANALIKKVVSGSFTADAYLKKTVASSFTANAVLKKTIAVTDVDVITFIQQDVGDDSAASDEFGASVAISRDDSTMVIGVDNINNGGTRRGEAWIYSGSNFSTHTKVSASDGLNFSQFGYAAAISGNGSVVVVGRPDGAAATTPGAVYVYSGSSWATQTKLTPSDGATNDHFGEAVAISDDGTVIVVGARYAPNGGTHRGKAYVYSGTNWATETILNWSEPQEDYFGWSVAANADGSIVWVGAEDVASGVGRVYAYSGSSWGTETKINAPSGATHFGTGVAYSYSTGYLVVGAAGSANGGTSRGLAYIYSTPDYTLLKTLSASDATNGDAFGDGVAITPDGSVLIGAPQTSGGSSQGKVYFYGPPGDWSQETKTVESSPASSAAYGHRNAVAISNAHAWAGSYGGVTGPGRGRRHSRTYTAGFKASALLRKIVTGSYTADSVIKKTLSSSFTADAYILGGAVQGSFTANSVIKKTTSGSFTANAVLKKRFATVQLVQTVSGGGTTSATASITPTALNALIAIAGNNSGATNQITVSDGVNIWNRAEEGYLSGQTYTRVEIWYALFVQGTTVTVTATSGVGTNHQLIVQEWSGGLNGIVDSVAGGNASSTSAPTGVIAPRNFEASIAAINYNTNSGVRTSSHDNVGGRWTAIGNAPNAGSVGIRSAWLISDNNNISDAWTLSTQISSGFAIVDFAGSAQIGIFADAVLRKTTSSSLTSDAVLKKTLSGSFTADSVLKKSATGSFTADSFLKKVVSGGLTADSTIKKTLSSSFTADADLKKTTASTLTANSYLIIKGTGSFTADSTLKKTTSASVTADTVLKKTIGPTSPTLSVVQSAGAESSGGGNATITLASPPTPGNVLFLVTGTYDHNEQPTYVSGLTFTQIGGGYVAHSSFGGLGWTYYRVVQTGDGQSMTWGAFHGVAISVIEVSGLDTVAGPVASVVTSSNNDGSTTVALTRADGARYAVLAGVSTRADIGVGTAMFSPNADTTWPLGAYTFPNHNHDGILNLIGQGNITIGGTLSGTTRDTYAWGGNAIGWPLLPITNSVTADAVIKKTTASSITADSVLKKTVSGSITADSLIVSRVSGSFTADSLLKKTTSGSFTADSYMVIRQTGSVTADATLKKTATGSFVVDATIKKTASGSITANSTLKATSSGSFTANADLKKTLSGSITSDAVVKKSASGSYTANALLLAVRAGSFTSNADIKATETGSVTADATIRKTASGSYTANALLLAIRSGSFAANADLRATIVGSFTADARIIILGTFPFTADAVIKKTQSGSFSADSYLVITTSGTIAADSVLKKTATGSFTADSLLRNIVASSVTSDAVLKATTAGSFTADADIKATETGSVTANAVILKTASGSYAADALLLAVTSGSFTGDSVLFRIISGSLTADAYIITFGGSVFTADAVLLKTQTGSFTADAYLIIKGTGSITADATLKATISGTVAADAVLKATSAGSIIADATLLVTQSGTLTADADLRATTGGFVSADAVIKRSTSGSFTAGALLSAIRTGSVTASAVILKTASGSFTADAYMILSNSLFFTADAVLLKTATGSLSADALLRNVVAGTFTADATLKATESASLTADATIKATESGSLTADSVLFKTTSGSFTADADLVPPVANGGSFTANAVLKATVSGSLTADSVLKKSTTGSFTADAYLILRVTGSVTANAVLFRVASGSLSANSTLRATATGSMTADAVLVGAAVRTGSFTANATLKARTAGSITADALLLHRVTTTLTANAVLLKVHVASFTADARLKKTTTSSLTADAYIRLRVTGSFTSDAVLFKTGVGSFTASANLSQSYVTHFTADAYISPRVTIHGSHYASIASDDDPIASIWGEVSHTASILIVSTITETP